MNNFFDIFAHIFFPNKCLACKKAIEYDELFCNKCCDIIPVNDARYCLFCNETHEKCQCEITNSNPLSTIISPFFYEGGIENAIIDLKFNNNRFNAKKLGIILNYSVLQSGLAKKIDIIIPIPMVKNDINKRGYNQSILLAKWLSFYSEIPFNSDILIKIKRTQKQHNLSAKQRAVNLSGAFLVKNCNCVKGKNVLLVDDVYTTGTTMKICSQTLLDAGCQNVIGLSVAKTRLNS